MTAFYNEIDPYCAQWLRNLIDENLIAPGVVDERSIEDIKPAELDGYTQCHFFAGIGVWSYALRLAGIPDDFPVWTGSCPCQPFSAAGERKGFADERHLWPAFHWLIQQQQPPVVFGEQVASRDGIEWFSTVRFDLENCGRSVAATDLCAAGFGAPHIRQRLFFVSYAESSETRAALTYNSRIEIDTGSTNVPSSSGRSACLHGTEDWLSEPSICRVVDGSTVTMDQLRAFGNAIVAQAAKEFIKAAFLAKP